MRKELQMAYKKPYHHTESELLEATIADLEVDIKCAERDGLVAYAKQCRKQIDRLREKENDHES